MNKIATILFALLLLGCSTANSEPTVGKILGVKQMLGGHQTYEIGIMVHANYVPYCTEDPNLFTKAATMVGEWVEVDWMLQEGLACPVVLNISLHDSKILENN